MAIPWLAATRGSGWLRRPGWWPIASILLGALLTAAAAPARAHAEPRSTPAEDVEAAYLYNFGKFVRWPESGNHGPLLICVAAQDAFAQSMSRLVQGDTIGQRPLEVRQLHRRDGPLGCAILFIAAEDRDRLDSLLAQADGKAMLTVSDAPDFLARGGMIQFVLVENHVRFSVNLNAAEHDRLGLSSELLKVAVKVIGRPGTGGMP